MFCEHEETSVSVCCAGQLESAHNPPTHRTHHPPPSPKQPICSQHPVPILGFLGDVQSLCVGWV